MQISKLLTGHISPETAFVVESYPYGFRLRCKIRYWLEYTPGRGVRFWSQTTNPKKAGAPWNKPKASTYCRFAGAMFLDEQGRVQWDGAHEYMDLQELLDWEAQFGAGVPEGCRKLLAAWIAAKRGVNEAKARGEVQVVIRTTDTEGKVTEERETLAPEIITPQTDKQYKCRRCGHVQMITTNHYGSCWSFGHFNCCPQCPPWAKYPEFKGQTVWDCLESAPATAEKAGAV